MDGIIISKSTISEINPPFFPRRAKHFIFFFFAVSIALIKLLEFPEVEIIKRISPDSPKPSICLEKTLSNPKSLLIAVNADESVVRAIAGKDDLSFSYLPISSEKKNVVHQLLIHHYRKLIIFYLL